MDKEQFIQLRAQGLSYDKIATELNISKPTLIKWSEECRSEIANLRYFEIESLITQYGLVKKAKIDSLAQLLNKAMQEMKQRSFEDLSTKELLTTIFQLDEKIRGELSVIRFLTGEEQLREEFNTDLFAEKSYPIVY